MTSKFNLEAFQFADTRRQLSRLAHAAETTERYDDMCQIAKALVRSIQGKDLTIEERALFSTAYTNAIASRQSALKKLAAADDETPKPDIVAYRKQIAEELQSLCADAIDLLENTLIPAASPSEGESLVAFRTLAGDYHGILAEIDTPEGLTDMTVQAKKALYHFEEAQPVAQAKLHATHAVRLQLALSYASCQYRFFKNAPKACEIAKVAFDEAISKLDQLDEANKKDSTIIMQSLRDKLTLWSEPSDKKEDESDNN